MKRLRLVLLAFFALVGVTIAVLYTPDLPLDELKRRWAPPPSKFMALDGLDVHYRDEGTGPPVLLLHGTGSSLHTWDAWVAALSPTHRVVRLDLPGFGLTGPAADGDYRIARLVAFVEAFRDKLGLDHFALAGNSWGGEIAWTYTLDHPEHVSALVLVDAAGLPRASGSMPLAFRLASLPVVSQLLVKLGTKGLVDKTVRDVYGDPSRIPPEVPRRYLDLTRREGNRASVGQRLRAEHVDRSGELGRLHLPVLILWGARDHLIPVEKAEQFHAAIAGSRLHVYPDAGHVPMEELGAETAAEVLTFLGK